MLLCLESLANLKIENDICIPLVSQPDINWTGDWRSMGGNGDEPPSCAVMRTVERKVSDRSSKDSPMEDKGHNDIKISD